MFGGLPPGGVHGDYGAGVGGDAVSQQEGLGGYLAAGSQIGGAAKGERGPRRGQTLTPVTVRMLEDAAQHNRDQGGGGPGAEYYVNGQAIGMVTIVACVESVTQQPLYKEYQVTDGSGRISALKYMDGEAPAPGEDVQVGDYVRLFGHLREWQGRSGVHAYRIARIESTNEIPYRAIEVAHVHLFVTGKLIKPPPGTAPVTR